MVSAALAPVTPGRVRQAEGGDAGAGRGQERVDVAVVAAGELHHLGAAREPAGQPDRRHRRLGAAADQPDLLDGVDARHDLLGQLDLVAARRAEGRPEAQPARAARRRPPGGRGRGSAAPTSRPGRRSRCRRRRRRTGPTPERHEARCATHRLERPDRRVHAARRDREGTVEEGLRGGDGHAAHPLSPRLAPEPGESRVGQARIVARPPESRTGVLDNGSRTFGHFRGGVGQNPKGRARAERAEVCG